MKIKCSFDCISKFGVNTLFRDDIRGKTVRKVDRTTDLWLDIFPYLRDFSISNNSFFYFLLFFRKMNSLFFLRILCSRSSKFLTKVSCYVSLHSIKKNGSNIYKRQLGSVFKIYVTWIKILDYYFI